jgi:sarcosine oxidase subunit gamma
MEPSVDHYAGIEKSLKVQLPAIPNQVVKAAGLRVLWLGPDEWLIVSESHTVESLARMVSDAVRDLDGTVVEVSAARTAFAIQGTRARDLLARGCTIDLDPSVFGESQCRQTQLARVDVILDCRGVNDVVVLVQASVSSYLVDWLKQSTSTMVIAN